MAVPKAAIYKWLLYFILLCQAFSANAQLAANFSATPVSGCAPLLVNFTDLSTGNPTSWKWDLGNGTISYLKNPAVTYFASGQYNVTLTVTNASGTNEIIKSQFITVYAIPTVTFTGTPLKGCFPLPVQFTDQSIAGSGTISNREWDFGDGNISSSQNPSHIYTGSGNFNATLRVTNSFGCFTTVTKPKYVQIGAGTKADFTFTTPNACAVPATINFTNTSTGSSTLNYQWDFGDGSTSTSINPSHIYSTAGKYTVKLIAVNSTGCSDTIVKVNAVSIGSVKADFNIPANICAGNAVTINNTSSSSPLSASWNFGDGTTSTEINPTKTFNKVGTYVIKMVANFGGCIDSVSKTINVISKLAVAFSADKTGSCTAPLTVNFTGNVPMGNSFFWDFGDGTTSTQQNPAHTYTALGYYNVKLVASNTGGCKDSLIKSKYIVIGTPTVSILNLPAKGCSPLPFTFTAVANSSDPIVSYKWDFGDGASSTSANPSHIFASGTYDITVTIQTASGCTATTTVKEGIHSGNKLKPNFTATPRDACAYQSISFTDLTTGGVVDEWLWTFNDGTTSNEKNPVHQFQDTGYFDIQLIVWNNGCPDTIEFKKYIHITPPIANFLVKDSCTSPSIKTFTNISIAADTWFWEFGDGTTSNLKNPPPHIYASAGTYKVKLTVTNFITGCSHNQTHDAVVIFDKADFTFSDNQICTGGSVNISAKNVNNANISSYYWNFGDGGGNYDSSVVKHTYLKSGTYNVGLLITNIFGCKDTIIKPLKVGNPTAVFKSSTPGMCLSTPVSFIDSSYSNGFAIQKWVWDFADGTVQTLNSPGAQHTYNNVGFYSVKLTVIDTKGCVDSVIHPGELAISKPVAGFTVTDTMVCHSKAITFNNISTGPGLTYMWDFGDGTTSTDADPVHTFSKQGTFNITLTITDLYGCTDKIIKNNLVTIADPKADFLLSDSVSTCPPLVINFTNLSKNYISRSWDFGDGTSSSIDNPTHFYTMPGTYNIVLTVIGYNNCVDTKTKKVVVRGPQGSFSYTNILGCSPLTTAFKGTTQDKATFIWDFSDGTTISTPDSNISHTYTNQGFYLPKMILVDASGCQVPIVGTDTIKVYGVKADFSNITTTLCDSGSVSFTDKSISNDIIKTYLWSFGDGKTSSQKNPVYSYSSTGNYLAGLKITTKEGCTDYIQNPIPIKVVASPKINIASNNGVCIPATITFTSQILTPDSLLKWNWNFGNGKTSTQQNPSAQVYSTAGKFNVNVIATNSSGCKDSVTKIIETYPLPYLNATADSILCKGQSINLSVTGAATYNWFPSTGLNNSTIANPVAKPDSNITYTVKGTSSFGCISWDTVKLTVRQPFKMEVAKGDTLCLGKSCQISASGASTYNWTPSTGLNNSTIANPVAKPSSTTNYMVVGKDDRGCFKDTGYVPVKVYPYPTVTAGDDKTINVGQTLDLDPKLSSDVTTTVWSPTSGIFRNRIPGITVKPPQTTEYTVEVTNEGGCKARDKVTVYVLCNNANVFLPNTFSPNGDGANDVFYPRGTGVFSIKTFRVFNRWGEVVYEKANFNANDASAGWNGTYKGARLNPDVFVYTIDIMCENNTILTYKGNIALIQ